MMVLAIGLTYLEDFCKQQARPLWLIDGIELISIMLFVTDSIAILSLCLKLLFECYRDLFHKEDESE